MKLICRLISLLLLIGSAASANASIPQMAQTDVAWPGIKLGMTLDQAKAVITAQGLVAIPVKETNVLAFRFVNPETLKEDILLITDQIKSANNNKTITFMVQNRINAQTDMSEWQYHLESKVGQPVNKEGKRGNFSVTFCASPNISIVLNYKDDIFSRIVNSSLEYISDCAFVTARPNQLSSILKFTPMTLAEAADQDNKKGLAADKVRSFSEALPYFLSSCSRGDKLGCKYSAVYFRDGLGTASSPEKAAEYFKLACNLGESDACTDLASAYYEGRGVGLDKAQAFLLMDQACRNKSMAGCLNLGHMYRDSPVVRHNPSTAVTLYDQACKGGYLFGCFYQAEMNARGLGIRQDTALATTLYSKACRGGLEVACQSGQALARQLAPPPPVAQARPTIVPSSPETNSRQPEPTRPTSSRLGAPASDAAGTAQPTSTTQSNTMKSNNVKSKASPLQVQMLADAIAGDSQSWFYNQYDAGSLRDVTVEILPNLDATIIEGVYTYNRGKKGTACIAIMDGKTCISYWDAYSCDPIRTEKRYENAPKAQNSHLVLVENALRDDSQSWLTRNYDKSSLNDLRIIQSKDEFIFVKGYFKFNSGTGSASITAAITRDEVYCIIYDGKVLGDFSSTTCKPVRMQTRAAAQDAYRDNLRAMVSNWRNCVNSYTFTDQHQCGAEPEPGFHFGF